jgi:hypothetical protein
MNELHTQIELADTGTSTPLTNAARLLGESMLPGASLMMDGKVVTGAAHALLGFGARALAGPAGIVLVAANSYSKSVTGKYLWDHVSPLLDQRFKVNAAPPTDRVDPRPSPTSTVG